MSKSNFYIQAVVDEVVIAFYVESASQVEARYEALRMAERRFPRKSIELRVVEKLRSLNPIKSQDF